MNVGLRIDLDTLNGTREGLPRLLKILGERKIKASLFFSVGPDNMGRHLYRLIRPKFLIKMLRSRAGSLYGWDILLRGTFLPGPSIANVLRSYLRRAREEGHEIGLHAWDHHRWQRRAGKMSREEIAAVLKRGQAVIAELTGSPPDCFAAPGWRGIEELLQVEETLKLRYGSDCRGESIFLPLVGGRELKVPQIPVTLPTYDEVIGRGGITDRNYNDHLLSLIREDRLNVLTIHAEVEGMSRRDLFLAFLERAGKKGITFTPLGELLPADPGSLPPGRMARGEVPGREGWLAVQEMGSI